MKRTSIQLTTCYQLRFSTTCSRKECDGMQHKATGCSPAAIVLHPVRPSIERSSYATGCRGHNPALIQLQSGWKSSADGVPFRTSWVSCGRGRLFRRAAPARHSRSDVGFSGPLRTPTRPSGDQTCSSFDPPNREVEFLVNRSKRFDCLLQRHDRGSGCPGLAVVFRCM